MCHAGHTLFAALATCLGSVASAAACVADTLPGKALQGVEVRGRRVGSLLSGDAHGALTVDMALLDHMPRIMGNADPLRFAQTLPGVQTNSELDAGLHIEGCDNQHAMVGIDGVPLYNVAHLFGFFSVFNGSHFATMRLDKQGLAPDAPNRLGATLSLATTDTIATSVGGSLAVGPMSSQATLTLPTGRRSALTLSGRTAYLNLLYGPWLTMDDEHLAYTFDDYNLTWLCRPDSQNTLRVNAYYGHDAVAFSEANFQSATRLRWRNMMAAVQWRHDRGALSLSQQLYTTHYDNRVAYVSDAMQVALPSSITDAGYQLSLALPGLTAGADVAAHHVRPQAPRVEGLFDNGVAVAERQRALEGSLFAGVRLSLARRLELHARVRGSAYAERSRHYAALDPAVTLTWSAPQGSLRLHAATSRQYLFRAGLSELGLPTEFWLASDARFAPQRVAGVALTGQAYLAGRALRVEADAYVKRLACLREFSGNLYDLLYEAYDLSAMLLPGQGCNYGGSVMVEKRKGRLTGWLSYSYGRARRRFDDDRYRGWFSASHERIHEVNAVATCNLGRRWRLGGSFVTASGTPYTSPRQFYLLSGNVLTEFGRLRANRLRHYLRLDLSASYDLATHGRRRSGLNFSVYNVTMRRNFLFYRLKIRDGQFANIPFHFPAPLLPSVNYFYQF